MGEMGRKIVKLDVDDLLGDLTRAFANEWMAHFYYSVGSHLVSGINGEDLAGRMRTGAGEELGHADMIAKRIAELGGEPPAELAEIARTATVPALRVPEQRSDWRGWLRALLDVERHVIGEYLELVEKTRHSDPVTHELAEQLLAAEVAEEEELENLLGD
jgi:bacterioferritin